MDRKAFYGRARESVFGGELSQPQVAGCEALLDAWDAAKHTDLRWLAYELATTYWETGRTMQPVAEVGHGAGRAYGRLDPQTSQHYYGRGLVQLTWRENYAKFGRLLGLDLVRHPDLALQPAIAAKILTIGMERGLFTGRKLADYFTAHGTDWVNARRIINGIDQARTIAGFAQHFYAALTVAAAPASPAAKPAA